MNPNHRHTTRRALTAVLLVVALEAAWASYAALRPVAPPESNAARAVVAASALPEEFRAIEPAGTDGSLPSIPVAEIWPAQR